jgi:hypothetical protein
MENSARLFAQPANTTDRISQWREDWRVARSAQADLQLVRMMRVNVLVIGTEGVIRNVLDMLLPDLLEPIEQRQPNKRLLLPPAAGVGTLILRDVHTLTAEEQRRLLAWLESSAGRTQIVSTAPTPLLPRIKAGGFLDTLYYRLNTTLVDASH